MAGIRGRPPPRGSVLVEDARDGEALLLGLGRRSERVLETSEPWGAFNEAMTKFRDAAQHLTIAGLIDLVVRTANGGSMAALPYFFLERYIPSYLGEWQAVVSAITGGDTIDHDAAAEKNG